MRRFRYTSLTIRIGALVLFSSFVSAKEPPGFRSNQEKSFEKSAQTTLAAILNINNFTSWQRGDGQGQYGPPFVNGDGGVYPRGTSWVVFADGFVWGAKAYLDSLHTQTALAQLIRVGGSTYNVGNEIGWIEGIGPGARAIGSSDPRARIYRIRRDWTTMTDAELRRDAAENQQMPISSVSSVQTWEIQFQYQKDWDEWPVQYGAPYIERNGIPGYQKPPPFSASFTPDSLIYGNYDEPGIAGANADYPAGQVLWTAFNDLNRNTMLGFAGCEPMGLELQLTLWGYDQPGGLENLYFRRLLMINKGGADIGGGSKGSLFLDSVFVGQWVDADVGSLGNDLNACDTVLQMGYTYNAYPTDAEFSRFNLPPPAVGYVLLGGPVVPSSPGDSAIRGFAERAGFKNLRMTSFYPKATGSAISDPTYDYDGALRWWRLLNGYLPDFSSSPWRLYPSPPGEPETKFPMAGDPVARTGFLDGLGTSYSFAPGERRFVISSGPFGLAPGDTQEVVVAVVGGMGADNLSSITVMKSNAGAARFTYENLLDTFRPARQPRVTAVELNGEIILDWGSDPQTVLATEETVIAGEYRFEGYHVYQLPYAGAEKQEPRRIATFDRKNGVLAIVDQGFNPETGLFNPVVLSIGTDSGTKRSLRITRDAFTGDLLHNGTEYSFAVTSYNYSASLSPRSLENPLIPISVKPRIPFGVSGLPRYGDSLSVNRVQGSGTGTVSATITVPTASTGDSYEVRFNDSTGPLLWSLRNISRNQILLTGQPLHSGADDPPIVEGGIMLQVSGGHTAADVFHYSTIKLDSNLSIQKQSAERVNVFPNPATAESRVTFSNLPQKAVISIYNLAGHLVRTLRKDDPSQFIDWNLRNEKNWQVGSGIYLCMIEMPDLDKKKLLKLAVIQQQLYPNLR